MRPRLLDLFCGAGGAAVGYHRAGFDVVGVDIAPQPHYPFQFVQGDALEALRWFTGDGSYLADVHDPNNRLADWRDFDAIHASPPCQAHTAMRVMWNAKEHRDLVADTRELLRATGLPYVIENVEGAPLIDPVRVCGTSLGLGSDEYELRRHRLFETNWPLMTPPCAHGQRKATIGVYGDHARDRRRVAGEHHDRGRQFPSGEAVRRAREAMEMPWADWKGLSQAVPPVFTELIGAQLLDHLRVRSAA